ncbi:MAG: hypothetical protein MZU79_00300 [Anaerotruncus sp.]|nr:hypothetical protein [Anaerotruncus sp.]
MPAVPHYGNLIGNLENLFHLVGDIYDRDALGLKVADYLEQMGNFAFSVRDEVGAGVDSFVVVCLTLAIRN